MTEATTSFGAVEYRDEGEGPSLLFVHGSPGGCDQGSLMAGFLRERGWRTISLSRPGYLGTALTDERRTPEAQAALATALLDTLGIDRVALMCWSGGGPSAFHLAASAPERVTSLVAVAAVNSPFAFEGAGEEKMLMGRFGAWLMEEMVRHAPKETVKSLVKQEGDLTKDERRDLVDAIWSDDAKRSFALDLMGTIVGNRKDGFENDQEQFRDVDIDLASVTAPVLLLHARTDADVPYAQSERARDRVPNAELVTIEQGTHVSVWTDPDADAHQQRIAEFLVRP